MHCGGVWDIVTDSRILDDVSDLLSDTVVLRHSHLFAKLPGDPRRVSWHQDASSWPLTRHRVVTLAPEIGSLRTDMQHHCFGRRTDSRGTRDLSGAQVAEATWGIGR